MKEALKTPLLVAVALVLGALVLRPVFRGLARPEGSSPPLPVPSENPVPGHFRDRSPAPAGTEEIDWDIAPAPGIHAGPVRVALASSPPRGMEIHYTTDGREPGRRSPRLETPLGIERSTVVRAAGFRGGERVTRVVSASYFIGPLPPLPVFSISLEPEDFQAVHLNSEGRGRPSEQPAYLEVIDPEGRRVAASGFGIRLHGGAGRQGGLEAKKAYRAYFRKSYGQGKLRFPLFPGSPVGEFDTLVLRSGYNDRFRPRRGDYNVRAAYLRDEVLRDVHRDMGALAARGLWCLLYVNMEPRGLYNVVERYDRGLLAAYLGGGEWDVIRTGDEVQSGSLEEWSSLLAAAARSVPGDGRSYQELRVRVDLENFASYIILNLWAQNHDWAYNNWYAARRRAPGERWIFLSWDAEWGLGLRPGGFEADTFAYLLSQRNSIQSLFASLLGHREFRTLLLEKVKEHLSGALRPENVLRHIARHRDRIAPVMEEELGRFSGGYSLRDWEKNVARAESFARGRGEVFLRQMEAHLAEPFRLPAFFEPQFDGPIFMPPIRAPRERLRRLQVKPRLEEGR